ncbi:MAG: hypothetical protein HQM11_02075 [SAR324 cluster bacterium]|nr:hypothetical protein [SAR324 cluster bacterium]
MKFDSARTRINFRGKLDEHTNYRLRLRMDEDLSDQDRIDDTGQAVQHWFLQRKWNDWNLQVGKLRILAGSLENLEYSGIDLYQKSQIKEYLSFYEMGIQANTEWEKQEFSFQITNSPFQHNRQAELSMNGLWRGQFFKKKLTTLVTTGVFTGSRRIKEKEKSGIVFMLDRQGYNDYHTSAGISGTVTTFGKQKLQGEFEIDRWARDSYYDDEILDVTGLSTVKIRKQYPRQQILTMIPGMRIITSKIDLFFRYSVDEYYEQDIKVKQNNSGTSWGVEWFPEKKSGLFRIHFVNTFEENKTFLTRKTTNQFNLGLTLRN